MQKLFSQEIRFKDADGKDFPDWEEKQLGEVSERRIAKNRDNKYQNVLTNSAKHGIIDQLDYFDKEIANKDNLQGYYVVSKGDFVYNPRISTSAPVGPINRNDTKDGIMSPLYSVFRFSDVNTDYFKYFFHHSIWHRYMRGIANYGARHDRMNITNADFLKMPISLPLGEERQKITSFLDLLTQRVNSAENQLTQAQNFKKGLLQKMFV